MRAFSERYVKAETIRIGDVIRATHKNGDVTISHVGTVAAREHYNSGRAVAFVSQSGQVIGVEWYDGVTKTTFTLLKPAPEPKQLTLDGLEVVE